MTALLPANFSNWNLSDWTTQYAQSGFSGNIPWIEMTNDISMNKIHLAAEQGDSAEMYFLTDFHSLNTKSAMLTLYVSVLGGYNPASGAMVAPFAHPQFSFMYATDIEMTPIHYDGTQANVSGQPAGYRFVACRVSFQTLPYYVINSPTPNPPIPLWCEVLAYANNDRVNAPAGYLVYSNPGGVYDGVTVPTGNIYTSGTTYVQLIYHRIPMQKANSSTEYIESVIAQQGAFTNSDTFIGCPPETLLIDSVEQDPYSDILGNKVIDVKVNLLFRPTLGSGFITWNKLRAANGSNYDVRLGSGGGKQYPPIAFIPLFKFNGLFP